MMQLNKQLLSTLESHVPQDMLQKFIQKYKHEQQNQLKKINTPATNCTNTSWRKQGGNAIDKIKKRRKNMHEKEQKEKVQNPINIDENVKQQSIQQLENNSNIQQSKMIIKNRAVFFGEECQLPYLHSSDAITHLYSKKLKEHQKQEILFNPTSNIDRSYMTSLRSLHIYHTNIQSLRQLGTGWCQLKQLSIIYGKLADLSGLSSFSSLEYLYLSFNKISSLSELMFHPSIKYVDLQRNKIENIQQIQYLSTMAKIESINLNLNPIMKIKQQKRIIQQKLSQLLQPQDYTRDIEYQLQDLTKQHEILGYQNIQMSNYLIRNCNQLMNQDQISFQNVYDSYQLNENYEKKEEKLDFLRYQLKVQEEIIAQTQEIIEIQQQEVIFTPLIHFLTGKKHYTTILKKYLQNKIYLNMKKKDNMDKSPGNKNLQHNPSLRLNKFAFSSKLAKDQEVHSLEKGQNFSKEANSLGKTKLNRLSLGKTRRLLQKVDKSPNAVTLTSKFTSNLLSKTSSGLKSFPLKRSSMLTKKSNDNNDLQLQMHKKFSQTATLNHEE